MTKKEWPSEMSSISSDLLEGDDLWGDLLADSSHTEASSMPTQSNEPQVLVDSPPVEPPNENPGNVKEAPEPAMRSLFVKVHMEGVEIGRKLNILRHNNYNDLVTTLAEMFHTTIDLPNGDTVRPGTYHVLVYEDKDGDWMLAGDVPWELFITAVRKLKIAGADNNY